MSSLHGESHKTAITVAIISGVFAIIAACVGGPLFVALFFRFFNSSTAPTDRVIQEKPTNTLQELVQAPPTPTPIIPTVTPEPTIPPDTPTPAGIQNPTGIVPAGTPIIADGLQLVLSDEIKIKSKDHMEIRASLINTGEKQKIVRYTVLAFKLIDDVGNEYPHVLHRKSAEGELYVNKQKAVDPGRPVEIRSEYNNWTDDSFWPQNIYIPYFQGPISPQASQIILVIDGFGSFPLLQVSIDL